MECPKCGTVQPDGREQCGRCGIVFERWRAHQERAQLMQRRTQSSPPPPQRMQIPLPIVIVGVAFVVILGLLWTKHHYAAEAASGKADVLDEINQKALQDRRNRLRIAQAAKPSQPAAKPYVSYGEAVAAAAASRKPLPYPEGLDESSAREIIENCGFFHDPRTFDIPRKFPRQSYAEMAARYPVLATAARQNLIELSPPPGTEVVSGAPDDITVSVTGAGYSQLDVHDSGGDMIQLGLGRRHLDSLWVAGTETVDLVTLGLTWNYEHPAAAALAADSWHNHNGAAKLHRERSGEWTLRFAWVDSDHGALYICP